MQAAIGLGQLEKLDRILELRNAAAARYGELLAGIEGVETPAQLAVLQGVECDLVQGYLFGGALSAEEMGERLSAGVLV